MKLKFLLGMLKVFIGSTLLANVVKNIARPNYDFILAFALIFGLALIVFGIENIYRRAKGE